MADILNWTIILAGTKGSNVEPEWQNPLVESLLYQQTPYEAVEIVLFIKQRIIVLSQHSILQQSPQSHSILNEQNILLTTSKSWGIMQPMIKKIERS